MTDEHRMEQLSRAYVQAVAAMCGCTCARPEPDYGYDMTFRRVRRQGDQFRPHGRHLDLQLKSTTVADLATDEVIFDLSARGYNLLRRATRDLHSLLVLLILSPKQDEWLHHTEDCLSSRGNAYWLSLRGSPAVSNTSTVRLHIPRANQFTPEALSRIMTAVQRWEDF